MNDISKIIKDALAREGIDLIGFASKERFAGVDPAHNPFSIFPEGKTVIMLGKRVCRGSLRGVEEGTNFGDYKLFGSNWLEDEFLSLACYNLVRVIEDEGWEAVPIFPNPPEIKPTGVSVAEGRPAPNVFPDFDYAAVACGIGEIGLNGMLLTKKFGARQRFHMIITDAEIEQSPLSTESVCDGCGKCAEACPLGAIDVENATVVNICGKEMKVAKIDYEKCKRCKNGACANRLSDRAKPDRMAALCNRTCLCHLESCGALSNSFHESFRKRDAWAIADDGKYAERKPVNCILGGVYKEEGHK
ncbi:MAG: 4Fe-4S binding protein [Clostridia bacterium]|nr:4Fe-4S binding protein [Clostridia bacterium]